MLESYNTATEMSYEKLSPAECEKRGILGRLVGPMADFKHPTRNGRFYSEKLWDKFFADPITQEKIKEKVFVGELGHPTDRTEVDMEKIAICLSELPKKGDDGLIYGVFDILGTPNGRILKTLCDYGSHIGVSSRGTGDTFDDMEGNESVDADTFECDCWDAVLVPAVKEARLQYVTESLNKGKTLKQALRESVESAPDDAKEIMKETLKDLDIDINNPEKDFDINDAEGKSESTVAADDDGAPMVEELQKALTENSELRNRIASLQEQLSVCYAKEAKFEEETSDYRNAVITLSKGQKSLREERQRVKDLTEALNAKTAELSTAEERYNRVKSVNEDLKNQNRTLHSRLNSEQLRVKQLNESVSKAKQDVSAETVSLKKENNALRESIADMKKNSVLLESKHKSEVQRLQEATTKARSTDAKLLEKYKKLSNDFANRYIGLKAVHLGVAKENLLQKLPEGFTVADVDKLCESMEHQLLNVGRLPFDLTSKKMQLTESRGPLERSAEARVSDDTIDDTLTSFITQN